MSRFLSSLLEKRIWHLLKEWLMSALAILGFVLFGLGWFVHIWLATKVERRFRWVPAVGAVLLVAGITLIRQYR